MIDLLVHAIGYESRSGHAIERLEWRQSIGIVFDKGDCFSFEDNLEAAKTCGSKLIGESDVQSNLGEEIEKLIGTLKSTQPIIAIDISSMSRTLMATALYCLFRLSSRTDFILRIVYSEGRYISPPEDDPTAFDLKPIVGFEGWSQYPERPLSLLIGLGYEEDQSVAAVEYFDPSIIRAFVAHGTDKRFLVDVLEANDSLKRVIDEDNFLHYRPEAPAALYAELITLTDMLSKRSRVVIVTGGPKIFSALSMLAQHKLGSEVSLWQISSHQYNEPVNVVAAGPIHEFDYKWLLKEQRAASQP